ncbi:ABC transporter permease [Cryobacterium sp. SO2]|uniref:ABC transporter permease n=1 Tax=Cryobacterium sp. SO2 TaxID=1897060 RepID=UPI00223D0E7B|nr:ABC transporter permease [Cryobacterium sp. SO2]WEO78478.1 ABC transporter permease [Cryobacterium sp. SO2]
MTTQLTPPPAAQTPPAQTPAAPKLPATRTAVSPGLVVAIGAMLFFVAALVVPGALATHDPYALNLADALHPPSAQYWFGTDEAGRDLYSRVVFGTRESLLIGLGATIVSLTLALLLGALAALGGRFVAGTVNRVIEVLLAFPTLLFALLLVAITGPSALSQVFAVGVGSAPGYARIIRGQILSARNSGYVEAAVALGHSDGLILRQHIVPNAVRPLVAIITLSIGQSIVWASSLSFLGLGVAPPSPEWGALLDAGRVYITQAWWLTVIPGLVIVALALAATTLGRHIQNSLEKGEK